MIEKLTSLAKSLSESRAQMRNRKDKITSDFLQISAIVKDVWTEHYLDMRTLKVDGTTFAISNKGVTYSGDYYTYPALTKLMDYIYEVMLAKKDYYDKEAAIQ